MKAKQKAFLKHFKEGHGIISYACQAAGIARRTYYNWIEKDEKFRDAVDEVAEEVIDVVESKLLRKINDEDLTAIIFYLKTKGKARGYVEMVENKVTVNPFEALMKSLPEDPEENPEENNS